jgi:hypothetical protein
MSERRSGSVSVEVWPDHRRSAGAGLIVEAWDRVDRELSVDPFQIFQVNAVLTASGEALESDDTAERGEPGGLPVPVELDRAIGNGVVYGRPAALASATTPLRSGPESSLGGMAGLHGGDQQGERLLGKLLAERDPLLHRERGGELGFLAGLLLVDLLPLGLVPGGQETSVVWIGHLD